MRQKEESIYYSVYKPCVIIKQVNAFGEFNNLLFVPFKYKCKSKTSAAKIFQGVILVVYNLIILYIFFKWLAR